MALLEVKDVRRSFGGLVAVNQVSFKVASGQIKAVIGPNGAGKTTLFNIISGLLKADAGPDHLQGPLDHRLQTLPDRPRRHLAHVPEPQPVSPDDRSGKRDGGPAQPVALGIRRLLPALARPAAGGTRHPRSRAGATGLRRPGGSAPRLRPARLSFGQRRMVELARALATEPELLLLDEPASGLNTKEKENLGDLIRRIRDRGVTMLLVEHDMTMVMDLSDDILVLHNGTPIAEGPPAAIQNDPNVIRVYLGGEFRPRQKSSWPGLRAHPEMLLQVKNLRCGYGSLEVVHGVSLHVCAGEIVGLLGANGAGKSSLLKSIVGLLPPREGEIFVDGRPTRGQPAWRSISNSTVLVPEGKMIFADMTVRENLLIGGYHNPDRALQLEIVLDRFPRLRERIHQLGGTLSGGEQQMLALGRALMARPKLLLLDEPSLGLAPLMVKEVFERNPQDEGPGHDRAAGRAERHRHAADRRPRLRDGDRRNHPGRRSRRSPAQSRSQTRLSGQRRQGSLGMNVFDRRYETMPRAELEQLQLERLQALLVRLKRNVRRYREKIGDTRVESLADLARLPFTTPEDMAESFPYGMFALPMREVIRLHTTVGPQGKPLVIGHTRNDLAQWGRLVARQLVASGVTANDVIQMCFGGGVYGAAGYLFGAQVDRSLRHRRGSFPHRLPDRHRCRTIGPPS